MPGSRDNVLKENFHLKKALEMKNEALREMKKVGGLENGGMPWTGGKKVFIRDFRGGKYEKTRFHETDKIILVQVAKVVCLIVGWTETHQTDFIVL